MRTGAALKAGSCHFTVWAPRARKVELVLETPGSQAIPMERDGSGYWSAEVPGVGAASRYIFSLDGSLRADPASGFQPLGAQGPSEVVDHASFAWDDASWQGISPGRMVIYEAHAGAFTPEGGLRSIIPRLDELVDLGINALELMPVAQFPGSRNWGYDGVFPYAVQDSYGGPEALKRLVSECHARGMAVILDVVYNHLGPEGNYLAEFGPYFTDRYRTPWGPAVNFDGAQSDHVREFFMENALHWFEHYHLDGLRLDAIHAIVDMSALPFLRALSKRVAEFSARDGRQRFLFAESDLNDPRAVCAGEHGFMLDAMWCDDFHHSVHALLTGDRSGYYADFGPATVLARSLNEGFAYTGQYSAYRERAFGGPSAHVPKDRFVVFVQNHDQVGNRMLGERLASLTSFEGLKLAAGALLLSPFVPLIFMGEEYGEDSPFLYFTSHSDERLARAVREGRKEEFRKFGWSGEPPAPDSAATFAASKLRWETRREGRHAVLLRLYKRLIVLRRAVPALSPGAAEVKAWASEGAPVVFLWLRGAGSEALAVFNFSQAQASARAHLQGGSWARAVDSAEGEWDGPGPGAGEGERGPEGLLAPLSFALFIKEQA